MNLTPPRMRVVIPRVMMMTLIVILKKNLLKAVRRRLLLSPTKKSTSTQKRNKNERWTLRRKKMKKRMARSKKMIPMQVEKAFRLQESLFADNELLMKIAGTLLSSWSHLGILPHCLS